MARSKKKRWIKTENEMPAVGEVVRVRTGNGDEFEARLMSNHVFTAIYFDHYINPELATHWRETE